MTLPSARALLYHVDHAASTELAVRDLKASAAEQRANGVNLAQLSDLTPNMGVLTSGAQIMGADITVDSSTSPATFTGSGSIWCYPPVEVSSGVFAVWVALNSGTVTFYINSSDGKLYAGGGAVTLDQNGLAIYTSPTPSTFNKLTFRDIADGFILSQILTPVAGTSPNRYGAVRIQSFAETDNVGSPSVTLEAKRTGVASVVFQVFGDTGVYSFGGSPTYLDIFESSAPGSNPTTGTTRLYSTSEGKLTILDALGQTSVFPRGDYPLSFSQALTTANTPLYSRTVKANELFTYGRIKTVVEGVLINNSGSSRTYTWIFNFGTYSLTLLSRLIGASATTRQGYRLEITTWNNQATNAQHHLIHAVLTSGAAGALGTPLAEVWGWDNSAIDTTADVAVNVTLSSSANTATQTADGVGSMLGPMRTN